MDIEPLLVPVAPDEPAGPDLSYSPERGEIEQTFERAASDAGGVDESDWKAATAAVVAQSRLTKDIWLAVYMARIGARSNDLELVEDGCALLAGQLERFWDTAHPKLEEYGVEGRKAPCESLVRISEFLGPLRRVTLVAHPRLGSYSGEDFVRFGSEGEAAQGYGQFRAAVAETPVADLQAVVDRFQEIANALSRADAVLSEQAAAQGQTGTNFEPTYEAIEQIQDAIRPFVASTTAKATEPASSDAATETAAAATKPTKGATSQIDSREDVARALDSVIDYYVKREPSSPIPEALRRIKGWIAMDFMAILRDISPNGAADAEKVLRVNIEPSSRSDEM